MRRNRAIQRAAKRGDVCRGSGQARAATGTRAAPGRKKAHRWCRESPAARRDASSGTAVAGLLMPEMLRWSTTFQHPCCALMDADDSLVEVFKCGNTAHIII